MKNKYSGIERRQDSQEPFSVTFSIHEGSLINANLFMTFWNEQDLQIWIDKMKKRFPNAIYIVAVRAV